MAEFKTIKQFTDEMARELVSRSDNKLSNLVAGSVGRSLLEAVASGHFFIQTMVKKVYRGLYIKSAVGLFLEALASNFGLERKRATYATGYLTIERSTDTSIEILKAGTEFLTEVESLSNQKRYTLQADVVFPVGVTQMQGLVQANNLGTIGNTISDTITIVRNSSISLNSVNNDEDINNGVDAETDEELKNRLYNKVLALLGGNKRTIRDAALSVEGVVYTFISDDPVTPGMSYLFVNNRTGDLDSSIVDEVRDAVETVRPMGVTISIARSPVRTVSIYCKIRFESDFVDPNLKNSLKLKIEDFINSLKPSQYLYRSDIVAFIENQTGVDGVVNELTEGYYQIQVKIDDSFKDIVNVTSNEMIRTSTDLITIETD